MSTDDVQYLDWQWVEEHPESALDLMLKLHSENARLREQITALGEIACLNLDDATVAECDAVTGGEKYKDVLRRLFVEQPKEIAELRNELAKLQEWTNQIRDDLEEACSERDANWEKVGNLVDLLIESLKYLDNHNIEAEGGAELVHKIKMAVIQDRGLWE